MSNLDKQYQQLLQDILDNGVEKNTRNGKVLSVFGKSIRYKFKDGKFPLLTTKKMAWKTMVVELLWFLRGDTNIKFLLDYDCHIWDGDAYKRYKDTCDMDTWGVLEPYTKEQFINKIKTNDKFAKEWGDLGPIYGKHWRSWKHMGPKPQQEMLDEHSNWPWKITEIDQIQNLINELKSNPDSRRLMVNAWNVGELDQMVLPPCHYGFQVYTRELKLWERYEIRCKRGNFRNDWEQFYSTFGGYSDEMESLKKSLNDDNIPTRAISLMWNQRSVDAPLGLPFNIASYALLLEIIAKEVNMVPDELIGNLGDCHIYKNQIDGVKEQLTREPYPLPTVEIVERNWYQHEKVKEHLGEKTFSEKILSYRPDCFILKDYQSHPKIKMPLSN